MSADSPNTEPRGDRATPTGPADTRRAWEPPTVTELPKLTELTLGTGGVGTGGSIGGGGDPGTVFG